MVLHVAFAGSVSVHVLLRKRDVGSATGWIGLAWLSPFIGSAIYFLFGINRVNRRARELHDLGRATRPPQHPDSDRDDHLAALDRAATRPIR
jgi:cardiolipin synthase